MAQLRSDQRGAGTLALSMLLLFGTSIVVFYLNRGLIFEQRTSANQARSTIALEVAEAGLEWATGMLNRPDNIVSSCVVDTANTAGALPFRQMYVQALVNAATPSSNVSAASNVLPGCYMDTSNGGALSCDCPAVPVSGAATASLNPASAMPSFTVSFANVANDPLSVRITSVGCSAASGACTSTTASSSDATATVTAIVKMRLVIRAAPAAALTCGTSCGLSGSFGVANFDPSTNGITINAGTTTSGTSGAIATIPGVPPQNSIVAMDASLSTLSSADPTCNLDGIFNAYFGSTVAAFAAAPSTLTINCPNGDCSSLIRPYYDKGVRSFYFPNGVQISGGWPYQTIGSNAKPMIVVTSGSSGSLKFNASTRFYGLIFANDATAGAVQTGSGNSDIYGAVVTCAAFNSNGNGNIVYDATALRNLQLNTATMVRVPGSWRDF